VPSVTPVSVSTFTVRRGAYGELREDFVLTLQKAH
jgi:hypothetical protein